MAAYRRGLDIMRRLTVLAPDHAAFKRGLAWFEARIADLEAAEGPDRPAEGGWWSRWRGRS